MLRVDIRPLLWIASFALIASACTSPADVGEECVDSSDCLEDLSCFEHTGAAVSPVCMRDCPLDGSRLCDDGSVCVPTQPIPGVTRPANLGICYLGGTIAVGAGCTSNYECTQGSICVIEAGAGACRRACRADDATAACRAGETCSVLTGSGRRDGYCTAGT